MRRRFFFAVLLASLLPFFSSSAQAPSIPTDIHIRILKAEDERRYDDSLAGLLKHSSHAVRSRAALAAGRIGDARAVPALLPLLQSDPDPAIRARAAFALGEIESDDASAALLEILRLPAAATDCPESCWLLRARAVEALGKIAAALPASETARKSELGVAILSTLSALHSVPHTKGAAHLNVILGLTAALRVRPVGGPEVVTLFLTSLDARVRADAANTLSRIYQAANTAVRRPTPSPNTLDTLRSLLTKDPDPIVRANAARALGAAGAPASAFADTLLSAATSDADSRVRVSAIRAVAQVCPVTAGKPTCPASVSAILLTRAKSVFPVYAAAKGKGTGRPSEISELLEIATTLGTHLTATNDEPALNFLNEFSLDVYITPEVEIAMARIAPVAYLSNRTRFRPPDPIRKNTPPHNWRSAVAYAQGLRELARPEGSSSYLRLVAQEKVKELIQDRWPNIAIPAFLRAYAAFKPENLATALRTHLMKKDVFITAAAADLLAQLPPDPETAKALEEAFSDTLVDLENDARLSILSAMAAQKTTSAYAMLRLTVKLDIDHLVRRRAIALLKDAGQGDFSSQIGFVKTRYTNADYRRALARLGTKPRAIVTTEKGAFTIELLPDDAPITVDNFIQLANKKFFDGITIHRVVPNFVVQDGDPRGDGEGGPGWQIRCEINDVPYDRGAVGMALSGKDTGGSQWFVTHSPQPHLEGGYTVFGRVIAGMDVVDRIVRLDRIVSIRISP